MASVSEHDTEEKRERYDSIKRRIGFAIGSNTISVDKILETSREFIGPVERGWVFIRVDYI